jgi:hypothetical protein
MAMNCKLCGQVLPPEKEAEILNLQEGVRIAGELYARQAQASTTWKSYYKRGMIPPPKRINPLLNGLTAWGTFFFLVSLVCLADRGLDVDRQIQGETLLIVGLSAIVLGMISAEFLNGIRLRKYKKAKEKFRQEHSNDYKLIPWPDVE